MHEHCYLQYLLNTYYLFGREIEFKYLNLISLVKEET